MDMFSAVDSFFTTVDSLALTPRSEIPSAEHPDFPVESEKGGSGGGMTYYCVIA